jgi:hypothetical protein
MRPASPNDRSPLPEVPGPTLGRLIRRAKTKSDGFHGLSPARVLRAVGMPPGAYSSAGGHWVQEGALPPAFSPSTTGREVTRTFVRSRLLRPQAPDPRISSSDAQLSVRIKRREILVLAPGTATQRIWLEPRADTNYLTRIRQLQRHLGGPPPRVTHEGHVARFAWQEGRVLDACADDERIAAVRTLLVRQSAANAATVTTVRDDLVAIALEIGRQRHGQDASFATLARHPAMDTLAGAPATLQHGDPSGINVVLRPDGSPVLIDWSPTSLGVRPFWSDAALLVSMGGFRPLMAGTFDRELAALWRSVDIPVPPAQKLRELMALAHVLFFALVSLSVDEDGRAISLTTGLSPKRLSKPWKVARAMGGIPTGLK